MSVEVRPFNKEFANMALDYILSGLRMDVYWELDSCSVFLIVHKELWWVLNSQTLLRGGVHLPSPWSTCSRSVFVNSNKSERTNERSGSQPWLCGAGFSMLWCPSWEEFLNAFFANRLSQAAAIATEATGGLFYVLICAGRYYYLGRAGQAGTA